jgi:hypothetical protein
LQHAPLGHAYQLQMLFALTQGSTVESAIGSTPLPPGCIVILPAEGIEYALGGEGEVIRIAQP